MHQLSLQSNLKCITELRLTENTNLTALIYIDGSSQTVRDDDAIYSALYQASLGIKATNIHYLKAFKNHLTDPKLLNGSLRFR